MAESIVYYKFGQHSLQYLDCASYGECTGSIYAVAVALPPVRIMRTYWRCTLSEWGTLSYPRARFLGSNIRSGGTVKEAQELARHAAPDLTMNVYGRVREDHLAEAVERVAEAVSTVKRYQESTSRQWVQNEETQLRLKT